MPSATSDAKVLYAPTDEAQLERVAASLGGRSTGATRHISLNAEDVEQDLARLVLTVIELLRQVVEKQAVRRVEGGNLTSDQIERLGQTLIALESRMDDLKKIFRLDDRDLSLNLGLLSELL